MAYVVRVWCDLGSAVVPPFLGGVEGSDFRLLDRGI
jgi:hypothetical protein